MIEGEDGGLGWIACAPLRPCELPKSSSGFRQFQMLLGKQGWIRTSVLVREQICTPTNPASRAADQDGRQKENPSIIP